MATELGVAYLSIVPSTKGLVPGISKEMRGIKPEAKKIGEETGDEFSEGMSSGLKKRGSSKIGGALKAGLVVAAAAAGAAVVKTFAGSIDEASKLEQSVGALEAVFKGKFGVMDEAARGAAEGLGMSRNEYNELATVLGSQLKNKGMEDFEVQTQDLINLGADLSAMYGGTATDAVQALSSLMRGERDPIEKYGVSINENAIKAELAAKGQESLTGEALESAKAQATLDILMRQTTDAQGAFTRESDTLANKQQVLNAKWADAKARIGEGLLPVMTGLIGFVTDRVLPGVDNMRQAWVNNEGPIGNVRAAFDKVWGILQTKALPIFKDVVAFVRNEMMPVFKDFAERVIKPLFENVVLPLFSSFWDYLKNYVGPVVKWLWSDVFKPTFESIGDAVTLFSDNWDAIWSGIQQAAAKPVNFVIDTVWNNGLRKVFNAVVGIFGGTKLSPLATVSWGSSSGSGRGFGRENKSMFWSGGYTGDGGTYEPKGIVHGGEYVLTKREVQQAGGWQVIDRRKRDLLHLWRGGYVPDSAPRNSRALTTFNGKTFSELFASTLAAAQAMAGTRLNISQGGFRPRTSYSGTSHQGDAVDIVSPITNAVIKALRMAGVAAWDRTGKGNWRPHIHGVPLPGRGYAAGSAVWQAQDYLRGGDGLGGRDNGPRVNSSGDLGNLFGIPDMVRDVIAGFKDLAGPWGAMLKDAFTGLVDKVKTWVTDKIGFKIPGFASGTNYASPGLALVGERGPELVNFRGGEQVYTADATSDMVSGKRVQITNHVYYPVAEPASVTAKKSLDYAAAVGF